MGGLSKANGSVRIVSELMGFHDLVSKDAYEVGWIMEEARGERGGLWISVIDVRRC